MKYFEEHAIPFQQRQHKYRTEEVLKMEIIESTTETPICPHCDKHIDRISARKIESKLGVRYLYFCSQCKKVLGVSHRKGFWMG